MIYQTKHIKRASGKAFSCPWLFTHLLFNKRTAPPGENSSNRIYFIDSKHSMDNFNTTESHRFSWLGKLHRHKKATVKSHSNEKE